MLHGRRFRAGRKAAICAVHISRKRLVLYMDVLVMISLKILAVGDRCARIYMPVVLALYKHRHLHVFCFKTSMKLRF